MGIMTSALASLLSCCTVSFTWIFVLGKIEDTVCSEFEQNLRLEFPAFEALKTLLVDKNPVGLDVRAKR
jgi:hypothetical protein